MTSGFPAVNPGYLTASASGWPLQELYDMGYRGLEVRPEDLGRGEWQERAKELSLQILSVNALPLLTPYLTGSILDAVGWRRRAALDRVLEIVSWIEDAGVPYLVVAPGRRPEVSRKDERARELLVSSLGELASATEAEILLESAPFRAFSRSSEILGIIEDVGRPNLKAAMDIGHALLSGEDPEESFRVLGSALRYVQVRDVDLAPGRARIDRHLPLGRGSIDIEMVRRLARQTDWVLCVSAPHSPLEDALSAIEMLSG